MEIYLARKKRVPSHYNPNSYRIFDGDVTDSSLGDSRMNKTHIEKKKSPPPPHPREPERRNCPHPWHSRFLRNNVSLLNEPICVMATQATDSIQSEWWPPKATEEPLKQPPMTKDTTQRMDFKAHDNMKRGTRHGSNPLVVPCKGILPVSTPKKVEDPGDLLLEKISYSHDYNCRSDPNEPIRGKLHGSFVWNQIINDQNGEKIVETPWTKRDVSQALKKSVVVKNSACKENILLPTTKAESKSSIPPIDGIPPPAD